MSGEKTAVAAMDGSLQNSVIADMNDDSTVISNPDLKCHWNGQEFADGDAICAEGVSYACHSGKWMKMPGSC